MLYDQAQMISLFSMAYKVYGDPLYKDIVDKTIAFLNLKMSASNGLYYAAMDADSDGEEGKYYSYTKDELEVISENTDFSVFKSYYNIKLSYPWENNKFLLLPIRSI